MLCCVALVTTEVLEKRIATIIRVTRIGELVTANVFASLPILVTLMIEAIWSYEAPVIARATQCNIPEDCILHSHRRENLKSFKSTY
jgi:hypothetical protein